MKSKLLRLVSFLVLLTFSFHELTYAYPITSTALTAPGKLDRVFEMSHADVRFTIHDQRSTILGKTIGGALAGIVNGLINLATAPIHIAYYASHGDWKGLGKYMGSLAIQAAMIAVQFIPFVGQALGFLFQMLGNFIQFLGANLIRFAIGHLGSNLFAAAVKGLGSGLVHLGARVTGFGLELGSGAGSFLKDLKQDNFSRIKSFIKNSLKDQLNPITTYRSILPDGVLATRTPSGGFVFLDQIKNTTTLPIQAGTQTSTFDLLMKVVLDTAVNAAIGAVQGQVEQFFSSNQTQLQGTRAPPINAPTLQASTDSTSNSKSISIKDPNRETLPIRIFNSLFSGPVAFAYDDQGTPIRYQSSKDNIPRPLQRINNNNFSADADEGRRINLHLKSDSIRTPNIEVVDNLQISKTVFQTVLGPVLGIRDYFFENRSQLILPEGISVENVRTYAINGILTSREAAQAFANQHQTAVRFNPSSGSVADLLEYGLDRTLGYFFPSRVARNVADDLRVFSALGQPINVEAHSQGTLILSNGLHDFGRGGGLLPEGSSARYIAPTIPEWRGNRSAFAAGLDPKTNVKYLINPLDSVPNFSNNYNPLKWTFGVTTLPWASREHNWEGYAARSANRTNNQAITTINSFLNLPENVIDWILNFWRRR